MAELQVDCVCYGHASVGLIYIRPEIDLATAEGKRLFQTIAERNSKLVKKYRGALSGEHGDGRIRAPFIKEQVGEQVYAYLLELKRAFDPHNLLNPGVIIGDMPITSNLRADRQPKQLLNTAFDWSKDLSLMNAVEKCNDAGACRKSAGNGVMCPSYQATREENNSTRGRSNLLRFALTEPNPRKALNQTELQQALEMCLGCKACKTECPANVDMARLKSEVLYQTRKGRFNLSDFALKHYGALLNIGQKNPKLFNWLQSLSWVKFVLGVDQRRTLPLAHAFNLPSWWQNQLSTNSSNASRPVEVTQTVWVLCDLYSQYQEPKVGQVTLRSLQKLGLDVTAVYAIVPRALISKGLLAEAEKALLEILTQLRSIKEDDLVVGIEPSELLLWRDEVNALLKTSIHENDQAWLNQKQPVLSFEELVLTLNSQDKLPVLAELN